MTIIDAHQHFWSPDEVDYPWLSTSPLCRRYDEFDLEPLLAETEVERTVIVQSMNSYTDTDAMFAAADRWARIAAIVGWVPLTDADEAAAALDRYTTDSRFVGVRHLIHNETDADWLRRPDVQEGLALLAERDLSFDIVAVLPRHLEHVPYLSERHPSLRMVIDHLAKPPIATGGWQPWAELLREAATNPNVYAKISGLGTAADRDKWTAADLRPYVDHAIDVFGPHRLMYGGDWPVAVLAGDYPKVWRETLRLLEPLGGDDRTAILGRTAAKFYRIPGLEN